MRKVTSSEERERDKKGERSGVRIPEAESALQAVVVLEAVLIDGLADLTADLAADGAAAEAPHGGSGYGPEDCSSGADERAIGGAELGGAQGCCGAAGGSCDSTDGGACGAAAVEGLDARGLALGATEHGEISLGCVM